jgi:isocitrate/isopropylmalate dehydrogenase
MKLKILVTAGDGIGPEVTNEAVAALKEIGALGGHDFAFMEKRIGGVAIVQDGTPLPADTLEAALAAMSSIRCLPTSGPRRGCCRFAQRWADSPTCGPHLPSRSWR